ncbi:MAG: hypothetical protein ACM3YN_12870 [Parcubacteria group bacterium]
MWKTSSQVEEELRAYSPTTLDNLEDLFGIRDVIDAAVPCASFNAPRGFREYIIPSSTGSELAALVEQAMGEQDPDNLALALLLKFFHHDLLINPTLSDPKRAWAMLEAQILAGDIKLPYRFGRTLYDKFNDGQASSGAEHLTPDDVDRLLDGAEQGIYQVGRYVTGPLGVLESREKRYLPAFRRLPLWHCSDTGCRGTHHVSLLVHQNDVEDILEVLSDIAKSQFGPPSRWYSALIDLHRREVPSRGREYNNLALILSDAIPSPERNALLTRALGIHGDALRREIVKRRPDLKALNSDALAERLSEGAQVQLLLMLRDVELVQLIDSCIWAREIKIPPTEVRKSNENPPPVSSYDSNAELSMFGIRTEQDNPSLFLADLVWREYERVGQLSELAWRCQKGGATPNRSIVLEYMKVRGVRDVVRKLVLPSRPIALAIADRLHCDISSDAVEDELVNRILWKCGFNIPRFDSIYARLSAQLSLFREEVVRYRPHLSEDDRDAIRAKGVNVFVSLEKVIEEIVSYNVWALSSDHFVETRFAYRPSDALARVSEVLGSHIEVNGQRFVWKVEGGNVLGVLLLYARAAANWVIGLGAQDREVWARAPEDIPHFASEDREARRFGFWHRQLWADADQNELSEFAREFDNLVGQLEKSRLSEVRNGLDHYRDADKFPLTDLLIACESRISSALQFSDVNRFIPKLFWMERWETDSFGLSEATFTDASGRKVAVGRPASISGVPRMGFSHAVVIPFGNLLGGVNSDLFFRVVEDSTYSRLWANYPRRAARAAAALTNPTATEIVDELDRSVDS